MLGGIFLPMQKDLIGILRFVDSVPVPELWSILVRDVSTFFHRRCFRWAPLVTETGLLFDPLSVLPVTLVVIAVEVILLLSWGYKFSNSGFQCMTTATKQKNLGCLKEFMWLSKVYSKEMLWLLSFRLFLPSSFKSMLTKKIIINKKKEKYFWCNTKIYYVIPANGGIVVQRSHFNLFGESIFPK